MANAIILPTIMAYNAGATGEKYRAIAKAMGVAGTESMGIEQARAAAIEEVKQLSADVGIPASLAGIVKEADLDFLAESAFADACCPGNPRDTNVAELRELYVSLL